jgi:hypothetical protein
MDVGGVVYEIVVPAQVKEGGSIEAVQSLRNGRKDDIYWLSNARHGVEFSIWDSTGRLIKPVNRVERSADADSVAAIPDRLPSRAAESWSNDLSKSYQLKAGSYTVLAVVRLFTLGQDARQPYASFRGFERGPELAAYGCFDVLSPSR